MLQVAAMVLRIATQAGRKGKGQQVLPGYVPIGFERCTYGFEPTNHQVGGFSIFSSSPFRERGLLDLIPEAEIHHHLQRKQQKK